jgi:uncharacterized membrane protein
MPLICDVHNNQCLSAHIFMIIIKSSVIKMNDVLSNQNSLYVIETCHAYVHVVILLYSLYSSSMFLSFWKFYLYCMFVPCGAQIGK